MIKKIKRLSPKMLDFSFRSFMKIFSKFDEVSYTTRYHLFSFLKQLTHKMGYEPYLNFISIIKHYKVFENALTDNLKDLYQDRNESYFRKFFIHKDIYEDIKSSIEWVYSINPDIKATILKEGIIIYDNYKPHMFNVCLLTIHSGTYMPKFLESRMILSKEDRYREEDVESDKLYGKIVLQQGGIWIDNKVSRFYCDLNRQISGCIYDDGSETWIKKIWEKPPTKKEREMIERFYRNFYLLLTNLLDSYKFNIIFDGHTMKDMEDRPNISLGTQYIPKFYLPIVGSIQRKIKLLGYESVGVNKPYAGGYILQWLNIKFPSLFIFSMEVNKKIYMNKDRLKSKEKNVDSIGDDLVKIFDIVEEQEYRLKT